MYSVILYYFHSAIKLADPFIILKILSLLFSQRTFFPAIIIGFRRI